jgi:hypothetical protein
MHYSSDSVGELRRKRQTIMTANTLGGTWTWNPLEKNKRSAKQLHWRCSFFQTERAFFTLGALKLPFSIALCIVQTYGAI